MAASVLIMSLGCETETSHETNVAKFQRHDFALAPDARRGLETPEVLSNSIYRATDYLLANCSESGQFTYLRDLEEHGPTGQITEHQSKYNLLRHAGAIYALCQRYDWQPDPRIPQAVERAAQFLARSIDSVPDDNGEAIPDLLAIWTTANETGGDTPRQAKLGGTGLGLVALLSVEKIKPGTIPREQIQQLGNFLRFMQRGDGSYYSRYVPELGGYDKRWTSLYYPGETALAFTYLYRWDGNPEWYKAALSSLLFLAEIRDGRLEVPADHWALLATEQLLSIEGPLLLTSDRRKLLRHQRQICRVMLNQQQTDQRRPDLLGSFTADGRTTPTATRVEGLTAALQHLAHESPAIRDEVEAACRAAVQFLAAAQYPSGPLEGGMPKAIGRVYPELTRSTKSLNQTSTEVRVDYVQHALSAWLQWTKQNGSSLQPDSHGLSVR